MAAADAVADGSGDRVGVGAVTGGGACDTETAGGSALCGAALGSFVAGAGIMTLDVLGVREDSCSRAVAVVASAFVKMEVAATPEKKMAIADKIREHRRIETGAAHAESSDGSPAALPESSGAVDASLGLVGEVIALAGVVAGAEARLSERGVVDGIQN